MPIFQNNIIKMTCFSDVAILFFDRLYVKNMIVLVKLKYQKVAIMVL